MSACTIQRGIFSLHACGGDAIEICSQCQRSLCFEHAAYQPEQILCPQCLAASGLATKDDTRNNKNSSDETDADDDWESPGWSMRWRDNYHESSGTTPAALPAALYAGNQFDDLDRNAFETRADGALGDDAGNDGAAGFSDS